MIYITGDMHGDESRFFSKEMRRLKEGDTLIVCGDFGFIWDDSNKEKKFLEFIGSRKFNIGFVDGTHENFDLLKKYRETVWKGGRVHRIAKNLFHLERGQIFNIDGLRLFTFGGGESGDREMRSEHKTWWRDELPSAGEMEEGAENIDEAGCEVDIIITHEPPSLVKSAMMLRGGRPCRVSRLNGYLEELNRSCRFQQWYFGYMHEDRVITPLHTAVFMEILPVTCRSQVAGKWQMETDQREVMEAFEELAAQPVMETEAQPEPVAAQMTFDAVFEPFQEREPDTEELLTEPEKEEPVEGQMTLEEAQTEVQKAVETAEEKESPTLQQIFSADPVPAKRQEMADRFTAFDALFGGEDEAEKRPKKKKLFGRVKNSRPQVKQEKEDVYFTLLGGKDE